MRKVTFICDHCGKEIPADAVYEIGFDRVDFSKDESGDSDAAEDLGFTDAHFCRDCVEVIRGFALNQIRAAKRIQETGDPDPADDTFVLSETPGQRPIDPPKDKKKKTPAKRRHFDIGKARALRTAGWSLQQIGDELHCSPQTVLNHLKEDTEK